MLRWCVSLVHRDHVPIRVADPALPGPREVRHVDDDLTRLAVFVGVEVGELCLLGVAGPDAVGREHTAAIWLAENPEKLTTVKTRILAKQGDKHYTARGDIGALAADLTLDKSSGMASAADVKMGPLNMKIERVHVSGAF